MRQVTIIILMLTLGYSQKINLNSATLEELQSLELTDNQIESIIDYRLRNGYIRNIYDLLVISEISISDIHTIRNTVTVDIPQASTFEKDMLGHPIKWEGGYQMKAVQKGYQKYGWINFLNHRISTI